jgi:hypothetical protein
MAGMFDAIIIPFSSVGIAESVNIFFDKEGTVDYHSDMISICKYPVK